MSELRYKYYCWRIRHAHDFYTWYNLLVKAIEYGHLRVIDLMAVLERVKEMEVLTVEQRALVVCFLRNEIANHPGTKLNRLLEKETAERIGKIL